MNKKVYKVLSSSVIATMLTLSIGTAVGQAEGNEVQQSETLNEVVLEGNVIKSEIGNNEVTITAEQSEVSNDEEMVSSELQTTIDGSTESDGDIEAVKLLPGDLFYFFKTLTEKVQLALTFNDVEKAKLLAEFTAERLQEAEALFIAGNEDLAYSTLLKALESQDLALDYSNDENNGETEVTNNIENEEGKTTEDKAPLESSDSQNLDEQNKDGITEKTDEINVDENTEKEVEEVPSDVTQEDITIEQDQNKQPDQQTEQVQQQPDTVQLDDVKTELQEAFTQNVHGLLIAIQNVKNPKALKALTKNLEKATKKFEKRYGKILKLEMHFEEKLAKVEEKVELGKISQVEAEQEITKLETELVKEKVKVIEKVQKDNNNIKSDPVQIEESIDAQANVINQEIDKQEGTPAINQDEKNTIIVTDKIQREEYKMERKIKHEQYKMERKKQHEEFKKEKQKQKDDKKNERKQGKQDKGKND